MTNVFLHYFLFIILSTSGLCFSAFANEITIPNLTLRMLSKSKIKKVFVPGQIAKKLKPKSTVKLRLLESKKIIGSARIESIKAIDTTKSTKKSSFGSLYLWFFHNQDYKTHIVYVLTLTQIKTIHSKYKILEKAIRHPFPMVPTVTKREIPKLIEQGAIMINVSNSGKKTTHSKLSIPNTKHLPYNTKDKYSNNSGYTFNLLEIPRVVLDTKFDNPDFLTSLKNKKKSGLQPKLIIYCQNLQDKSCPRALLYFRWEGFKNIYWYRGGAYDWFNRLAYPPTNTPGIKTSDTDTIANIRKNKHVTIDVRPAQDFKKKHIAPAINLPFPIEYFPNFPYKENQYPKLARQIGNKTKYDISLLERYKTTDVIIYSSNKYIWLPYYAAITLRDAGFKKVHYYRDGLQAWQSSEHGITILKKKNRKRRIKIRQDKDKN